MMFSAELLVKYVRAAPVNHWLKNQACKMAHVMTTLCSGNWVFTWKTKVSGQFRVQHNKNVVFQTSHQVLSDCDTVQACAFMGKISTYRKLIRTSLARQTLGLTMLNHRLCYQIIS